MRDTILTPPYVYLHLSVQSLRSPSSSLPWGQTLELLLLLTSEPPGEMEVGETRVADTCDVSILRRGEFDSGKTYKWRCCQIMHQPWGTIHLGGGGSVVVHTCWVFNDNHWKGCQKADLQARSTSRLWKQNQKHFLTFLGNIKRSHDDLMFKQQQRKNPAREARDRESSLLQNVPVPSYVPINTPGDYFNGAVSVRWIQNLIKTSVTLMKNTAPFLCQTVEKCGL